MKLKTQLLLNTFFVIFLFILSYAVIYLELQKVEKIHSLSETALKLRIEGNNYQISTNQIFLERNQFSVLIRNWKEKSNQFDTTLNELIVNSNTTKLPQDIMTSLESLQNSALAQNEYKAPFERTAQRLLEEDKLASKVQFSGLYGYFLSRSPDEAAHWKGLLEDLEKDVENVYKGYSTVNNNLATLGNRLNSYQSDLIQRDILFLLVLVVAISIFSIIYVVIFSHKLSLNFINLEETMKRLAERDLTILSELKGSREVEALGSHINDVTRSFHDFISEVNQVSNQTLCLQDALAAGTAGTLSALREITKSIDSLEETITLMEDDTEITADSVQTITGQIQQLNVNIKSQYNLIQSNLSASEQLSSSINNINKLTGQENKRSAVMVDKLNEGEELAELSQNIITKVSKTIQEVMTVTGIINDISDQTNILSMNAAIESAHAGEAGKGFAVVAEEIRSLAESTSENSHQIDEILKKVSFQIDEALNASTDSYKSVGYLKEGLKDLSGSLIEINHGMDELSSASRDIVHSSQNLHSVTANINDSSQLIQSKSDDIGKVVSTMKGKTEKASVSIKEIGKSSREITETMTGVHQVSEENKEGMSRLEEIVHSFKTEETTPQECQDFETPDVPIRNS